MVVYIIDHTDAVDLHNDNILIFKFIDMGTFRVGIKVEFKIIQYVYAYVISQNNLTLSLIYYGEVLLTFASELRLDDMLSAILDFARFWNKKWLHV